MIISLRPFFLARNLVNASVPTTATHHLDEEAVICRAYEVGSEACEIRDEGLREE